MKGSLVEEQVQRTRWSLWIRIEKMKMISMNSFSIVYGGAERGVSTITKSTWQLRNWGRTKGYFYQAILFSIHSGSTRISHSDERQGNFARRHLERTAAIRSCSCYRSCVRVCPALRGCGSESVDFAVISTAACITKKSVYNYMVLTAAGMGDTMIWD